MIPAFTPACPYCLKPMQKCSEKFDGAGKTIYVQYICACRGGVYYENYHAGDAHKEKQNGSTVHQGGPRESRRDA